MRSQWSPRGVLLLFWAVSIAGLFLYSGIYFSHPIASSKNDPLLDAIYLVAVVSPAWIASAIWKLYAPADTPGRIWRFFTLGFWSWFIAEAAWVGYNWFLGDVPNINLSDPFYLIGYVLMTVAIASQYRQTRYQSALTERSLVLFIWVTILLVSGLVFFISIVPFSPTMSTAEYIGSFLNTVYGVGDMTLAVAALLMITIFRGGALGRPWWGFIILAIADVFYGFLIQTGAYYYQTLRGDLLRLTSVLIYMLSYLIIAYSFLRQYALLRFGPSETSSSIPRR